MAEFQEVIRQYKRMCSETKCTSSDCPILRHAIAFDDCDTLICKSPKQAEEIIMEWAANHPETVYPTWEQWHEKLFPNSLGKVCPSMFVDIAEDRCSKYGCDECRNTHITAEIATKLGIEPSNYQ